MPVAVADQSGALDSKLAQEFRQGFQCLAVMNRRHAVLQHIGLAIAIGA